MASPPTTTRTTYTGPSNTQTPAHQDFHSIHALLTNQHNYPVLPPSSPSPFSRSLSHDISSLHLHPALEALLHILNNDLPSAHFLCRHMESAPAFEGMYAHGLLHRIEGDYRNAEAWYGDVAESECFRKCWPGGGLEGAKEFIGEVERLRRQRQGDLKGLESESKREIEALIEHCVYKFGTGVWVDGCKAWVEPSEKIRSIAAKQVVGGEGWRQF
ncbi:hypothetical protein K431DRAFT_284297 [Polychaeton citri CBS 116435]|uniref:Uncharacterized protein n=1 Tax=Polychaeton citri CBS 116435 TaxID=1314669 RepID=A0A9P4QCD0_9PEZI|nr:hypothetical protein K431DRAFT_284297 [Polychaeton citri CBS 116435]